MKTAKELVDQINSLSISSPHYLDDEIYMTGIKEITTIDRDEHRWYVIGTMVFKVGDEFFGVCGPVSLKSESMTFDDTSESCEAFEMDEVQSVTYKRKPSVA